MVWGGLKALHRAESVTTKKQSLVRPFKERMITTDDVMTKKGAILW